MTGDSEQENIKVTKNVSIIGLFSRLAASRLEIKKAINCIPLNIQSQASVSPPAKFHYHSANNLGPVSVRQGNIIITMAFRWQTDSCSRFACITVYPYSVQVKRRQLMKYGHYNSDYGTCCYLVYIGAASINHNLMLSTFGHLDN